jgi:PBP1b-binding outer membrane lipoprotein LpoB
MKAKVIALVAALALALSACASDPGVDPKVAAQDAVDKITLAYMPLALAADLCVKGVICADEAVIAIARRELPLTASTVKEVTAFLMNNATAQSDIVKWTGVAMSAIRLLAERLQAYGVKVA